MKKQATLLLVVFGLLILVIPVLAVPQTTVSTVSTLKAAPNPAGVGQLIILTGLITPSPPASDDFQNVTINLTLPNGILQCLGPFTTASNGSLAVQYNPANAGNYTFVLEFPGELFTGFPDYLPSCGQVTVSVTSTEPTSTPTLQATPTSTATPTVTSAPTPQSSNTLIQAATSSGSKVDLELSGNVTSSQMSAVTFASNLSNSTITISFDLTGQTGTIGFGNVTIPKNVVSYGLTPTIYIDNQKAPNQGFTQDSSNYYVWYTTHFSTHQVSIVFNAPSSTPASAASQNSSNLQLIYGLAIAVAVVVVVLVVLQLLIRGKQDKA